MMEYDYQGPYFGVDVFHCERTSKTFISISNWPLRSKPYRFFHGCYECEDNRVCDRKRNRKNTKFGFSLKKRLKNELLLFNEEGIGTETRIGRFLFKIKKG